MTRNLDATRFALIGSTIQTIREVEILIVDQALFNATSLSPICQINFRFQCVFTNNSKLDLSQIDTRLFPLIVRTFLLSTLFSTFCPTFLLILFAVDEIRIFIFIQRGGLESMSNFRYYYEATLKLRVFSTFEKFVLNFFLSNTLMIPTNVNPRYSNDDYSLRRDRCL